MTTIRNIPEGGIEETEFEALSWQIGQDASHLGGQLTIPYAVAWYGTLLALYQCKEITDSEYEQLLAMLPVVEDDPVKEVEAFMSRYTDKERSPS